MHRFVLLINGQLEIFHTWESIPEKFDHVIEFVPEIPDGPHTQEQHDEIEQWHYRLQSLIAKENKNYGNN